MSDDLLPKERETCHFLGSGHGFGPVRNAERILFAVFSDTPRSEDNKVTIRSFNKKNMNNVTQSVVRTGFVTREQFNASIVGKKQLHGISTAAVQDIRDLRADVERPGGQVISVRAACVLDLVEEGDCEGHATIGFSDLKAAGVSDKMLGVKREFILMELARNFSGIRSADDEAWTTLLTFRIAQLDHIRREARTKGLRFWIERSAHVGRDALSDALKHLQAAAQRLLKP